MKNKFLALTLSSAAMFAAQPAMAITWIDWTSSNATGAIGSAAGVTATFTGPLSTATFSGPLSGATQTSGGIDFYTGTAFPAAFKPSNTDIVVLNTGGTKTINFSREVIDVYLALVSWNNSVTFSNSFTTVTPLTGCGYWGCGTIPASGTGFSNAGEVHGVLKFAGPITSLSFTDTSEFWHGMTVGFESVSPVPEPAIWASMMLGFGVMGASMRRRKVRTSVKYT